MKTKKSKLLPLLACATAFGLWGLNTPLIKISLTSAPIFPLLLLKYGVGAVVFLLLAKRAWKPVKHVVKIRIIIATLSGYVACSCLYYKGIELTGGLNASLIYLLAPLMLYFASIRYLNEKFDSKLLFGVAAGFAGALIIVGAPLLLGGGHTSGSLLGNALVLAAVAADVGGLILIKPVLSKVPIMQMVGLRFAVASIVLIPFALPQMGQFIGSSFDTKTSLAIGYSVIFSTLAAYYLYHWGVKRISGEQISPLQYLIPMVGSIGSFVILGERPTVLTILGVCMIAAGLYFSEVHKLGKHKRHHGLHGHHGR